MNRYVSAPLVSINDTKPSGSNGVNKAVAGRYAWWIGDDGTKSKINATSELAKQNIATYASLSSPRRGWETVDGFSAYPLPDQQSILERVITLASTSFIDDGLRAVDGDGSPMNRTFHSATTQSLSVLSDPLRGGLRVDLTPYLHSGFPGTAESDLPNAPQKGKNIIPGDATLAEFKNLKGPKWDLLKDFASPSDYLTNKQLKVRGGDGQTKRTIAPTIIDFRLLMGVRLISVSDTSYRCHPCGKFAVTIANPYPYDLKWDAPLDFEVRALYNATEDDGMPGAPNNVFSSIWGPEVKPAFLPGNAGVPSVFGNATFRIGADSLKAGEARAYTISSPVLRPQTTDPITIPLSPFASSSPADMNMCIEMQHSSVNDATKLLDVREQWTTSLISLIMRSGDSQNSMPDNIVRRIERVELDNGFFSSVRRSVDGAKAKVFTSPFPMQLYSFQISHPGSDYASILPNANLMGTRSSTVRTFTDFNLQANRFSKIITSYNPPPFFMESTDALAQLPFTEPGGETGLGFTRNLAINPVSWGRKLGAAAQQTVLFGLPDQLVSLAQLQHLDLTADDVTTSVGHQPGNAVGNSYAPPFVKRELTRQERSDYVLIGINSSTSFNQKSRNYYDMAHLLNTALWDSYFLSTIPPSSQKPINESLMILGSSEEATADLHSATKSAAHLLVNGGFSVQSTQKDAWKALLASVKHQKHPADSAANNQNALFPRSLEQLSSAEDVPSGSGADSFSGFRRLTDAQIDALAEELCRQVRLRGPFVSLSHFINRALVELKSDKQLGRSGALQSAIDNATTPINTLADGSKTAFGDLNLSEDKLQLQGTSGGPRADLDGVRPTTFANNLTDPVWAPTSKDLNPGAMASMMADREMITDSEFKPEQGFRSSGIPGWLTQADVLQAIGPVLSARSDTFRIRAYGESLDPSTGKVAARAWCEATVQRLPDFIDGTNNASDKVEALTPLNRLFGRKFIISSFRWLSPNEI